MTDLTAVQIKSRHVDTSVLALQNTGVPFRGSKLDYEQEAHGNAVRVKEFLDHNTNAIFKTEFNKLFMHDIFSHLTSLAPEVFQMTIEAETGREMLRYAKTGAIIAYGSIVTKPLIQKEENEDDNPFL